MSAPRALYNSLSPSSLHLSATATRRCASSLNQTSRPGSFNPAFAYMNSSSYAYGSANGRVLHKRQFSNTARRKAEREPFHRRLRRALGETKIKWYPIPAVLGIGFLGLGQLYRVNEREKKAREQEEAEALLKYQQNGTGGSVETDMHGRKYKRKRIRPSGPW